MMVICMTAPQPKSKCKWNECGMSVAKWWVISGGERSEGSLSSSVGSQNDLIVEEEMEAKEG